MNPNLKRLRRSMMFLNCQKPALIKDPYIYKPDSIMLDLEDAVAEREKDAARYSLFHALREIDYRGVERVVRINGLDTDLWREDIRCAVAGGCDSVRIPKTETAEDVRRVEAAIAAAEQEFGVEPGRTLIMAALESARGVMNAFEVCQSSPRLFGIALSGGDYTKDLQTTISGTGVELMGARQHMIIAARAAGVQCFDTVYTNLDDMNGLRLPEGRGNDPRHGLRRQEHHQSPPDPHRARRLHAQGQGYPLRRKGRPGDRHQEGPGHRRVHRGRQNDRHCLLCRREAHPGAGQSQRRI